ncbi:GNAT family N-acetyltransferase [Mesobacillus zeae]|uniref:GNAT family N-acetyltransferase n=1 Tax=Mesobacillus zeae TaxID=1917180 RepID=A0A398AX58_9BACI|nr:GNAT family N-acetyltransferase [Mesobacillus zeae]RID82237.1 GNAT family N-acetyltransferase [Mesobacillus zeae]
MKFTIRAVEPKDARDLHRIYTQEEVLPYMGFIPSMRLDSVENRLRSLDENQHEFVAVTEDKVIGFLGLTVGKRRKAHSGSLYIGVDSGYHGQGVGQALLTKVIDLADNWLMLERLELGVLATNPRAKALYERCGFKAEGKMSASIVSNGEYVDEFMMARLHPNGLNNKQIRSK